MVQKTHWLLLDIHVYAVLQLLIITVNIYSSCMYVHVPNNSLANAQDQKHITSPLSSLLDPDFSSRSLCHVRIDR